MAPFRAGRTTWGLVAAGTLLVARCAGAQTCEAVPHSFTEGFDDVTYQDPASSVEGWGRGAITLARKATSFAGASNSVGQRVYVVADGDFDRDGRIDMVALMLSPTCHLHFLRNLGATGDPPAHQGFDIGGAPGDPLFESYSLGTPPSCSTESPVLLSGDFDADGDEDLLYMRIHDENYAGELDVAVMYRNDGVVGGVPQFSGPLDVATQLGTLAWHWTSTVAKTIDWPPRDGVDDLVVVNSSGPTNEVRLYRGTGAMGFGPPVTLVADIGLHTPIASASLRATGNGSCPPAVSRGANALLPGDFDDDGDLDIVVGSASERDLKYWINDGSDVFYRAADIPFAEGGAVLGLVGDFDSDGDADLMIGRDGYNCGGSGGTLWFFVNDGEGNFAKRSTAVANAGADLDFGIAFDIDGDPDGRPDAIVADGNNSGSYLQVISNKLDIFNLTGTAISRPISTLGDGEAIVSVTLSAWTPTGLAPPEQNVEVFVSNDDGVTWERLTADELPPTSAPHAFLTYGNVFRWRAELTADADELSAADAVYAPASNDSPVLGSLSFTYEVLDRRAYSRSSLAYGEVDGREHLFAAWYLYPGFEATVRAFDIDELARKSEAGELERVDDRDDVTVSWDGGTLLRDRSSLLRQVYGVYAAHPDGRMDDLVEISEAEAVTPTSTPTLQTMLAVDDATRRQVVRFVRGRRGDGSAERHWKFFDVGHSSPIFVAAPHGDAEYLGDGYAEFREDHAARAPTVYIGANDGMLRAFDAATGDELWAIVPNNLLAKLKTMRRVDATGVERYAHEHFVDGRVVVRDVFDGSRWRTIAVAGQALGQGLFDNNYYFAVDITEPASVQPLWEFTDPLDAPPTPCSGAPCTTTCVDVCAPQVCDDSCTSTNHSFTDTSGAVAIEAEHFNVNAQVATPHLWQTATALPGYSGDGYVTASPNWGVGCGSSITSCGAQLIFDVTIENAGNYYVYVRAASSAGGDDSFNWGLNGALVQANVATNPDNDTWQWLRGDAQPSVGGRQALSLAAGDHTFHVWMREDGVKIDKIVLSTSSSTPTGPGPDERCKAVCEPPICTQQCTETCLDEDDEWPECGAGSGRTCCAGTDGATCRPIGTCSTPIDERVLGEAWSPPAFGRIRLGGADKWIVLFGSGYNNRPGASNVGRTLYALDAVEGTLLGRWDLDDIPHADPSNPSTIDNTVPGGPSVADVDGDGYIDRSYVGDLEGRLWRLAIPASTTLSEGLIDNWELSTVFDAGSPGGSGARIWAPIITKPAIAIIRDQVHVYFGTGGDDRAPDDQSYRFYAIRDVGGATTRYPSDLIDGSGELIVETEFFVNGPAGHKFWSDPLLVNGTVVYFASLQGDIESVNPCTSIDGGSFVYAYAIRGFTGEDGTVYQAGDPIFAPLAAGAKIRQALVLRGAPEDEPARPKDLVATSATDVFLQEFSSSGGASDRPAIRRVRDPGVAITTGRLRIMHWREVPLR